MTYPAYHLLMPKARDTSVVFASPHSGRAYAPAFVRASVLDGHSLRSSEDAFVDQLFCDAPRHGAPLLLAGVPRAYVDLNRSATELDPALIDGVRKLAHNPRIAAGLGVVPRVVAGGRAIYRGKIPLAVAEARIAAYWAPYHAQLRQLLDQSLAQFGQAILIDCHSMPREALDGISHVGMKRPDVVLGDRFGASAGAEVVDIVESALVSAGLRVARNAPFAGAYIAQAYGRPARGQHVVQIEIDRSLYMDEAAIRPNAGFAQLQSVLAKVVAEIAAYGRASHGRQLAAE